MDDRARGPSYSSPPLTANSTAKPYDPGFSDAKGFVNVRPACELCEVNAGVDYMSGPHIHTFLGSARAQGFDKGEDAEFGGIDCRVVEVGLVWAMVWSWQLTWVGMVMAALSAGLWRCRQE